MCLSALDFTRCSGSCNNRTTMKGCTLCKIAAAITIFVDSIVCVCEMGPCSDKSTENDHSTLQLPSALQMFQCLSAHKFWFYDSQLSCFSSLSVLSWCHFEPQSFIYKAILYTTHSTPSSTKVNKQPVNLLEHLTAFNIFSQAERPKTELQDSEY